MLNENELKDGNKKRRWTKLLEKLKYVLVEFQCIKNEFEWDDDSLKEAADQIESYLHMSLNDMSLIALKQKLKQSEFELVHSIKRSDALSNGAVLEFKN
jgi:hypothetical protein